MSSWILFPFTRRIRLVLLKANQMRRIYTRFKFLYFMVGVGCIFNILFTIYCFQYSLSSELNTSLDSSTCNYFNTDIISTIERSTRARKKLEKLLDNARSSNDKPWIWIPTDQYPSVPYQPPSLLNKHIPRSLCNITVLPQSVTNEIDRVCKRLNRASKTGGKIWCKLFNKSYTDTFATTTLLDDNSTYIITGDIDLMWLRDSSAQVHQYLTLSHDPDIQHIIEGLIRRQVEFIFYNPYASSFRLNLRPNPPSDDSLAPIHLRKGRNIHVAMHNYELDSLCYHIRLSYSWWKQSQRLNAFNHKWLISISMIIQVMIIEQHHSEISPYHYTELANNHTGSPVAYTGMTWSGFRPSDDATQYGYLIPSNMMASVALEQLSEMIGNIFPEQMKLSQEISQLRADILAGINTYGIVKHKQYGKIYAFETNGFSEHLLIDDANVPSLLSAPYLGFKTPYDPHDQLIRSTRRFILSNNNSLFFKGKYASGIGSAHTDESYVWPMAIIMEGLTVSAENEKTRRRKLDSVWRRLEASHAGTFSMHESFDVDYPEEFTRPWFAWVNSLFAELILTRLDLLENWLYYRRRAV